jgi:hypothetical protein
MEYKPFDRNLFRENDLAAKQVAVDLLQDHGFKLEVPLQEQEEQYKKWDLIITRIQDQKIITVEAELKKVWTKSGTWQGWPCIDVPYRKKDSKANLFIMSNVLRDTAAVTTMDLLKSSPVSSKKTIYTDHEYFFNCPLQYFRFYHKTKDSWIKILP